MADNAERPVVVVGVDPGGTTGWAVLKVPVGELADVPHAGWVVDAGQVPSADSMNAEDAWLADVSAAERLAGAVEGVVTHYGGANLAVCEDFILVPAAANAGRALLSPVRVLSALLAGAGLREWWGPGRSWYDGPKLMVRSPSAAKTTCTDERMRDWELWQAGSPHATDALRHAVLGVRELANHYASR